MRTWQARQSIGAAKDQIEETHVLLGFQAKDTRRRMEDDEKAKAGKGCSRMRSPYILIAEVATKENTIFFAPRESSPVYDRVYSSQSNDSHEKNMYLSKMVIFVDVSFLCMAFMCEISMVGGRREISRAIS